MTELLQQGEATSPRGSPAYGQIVRRWIAVVLMYLTALPGVLITFGGTAAVGGTTTNGISGSTQLGLIAVGVGITLLFVLPTTGLARRIRLRSSRAGWATIMAGCLVLVATGIGFFGFLFCGVLMIIVGLPLSKFRLAS